MNNILKLDNFELQIERDIAIGTKSQISRRREATVMGRLSQLTRKIGKLTDNEKHEGEYTATEVAIKTGIYSKNGNPHSQVVSGFLSTLPNKDKYMRTYKTELPTGQIVDGTYFNEKFVKEFTKNFSESKDDIFNCNGRNYRFNKLFE